MNVRHHSGSRWFLLIVLILGVSLLLWNQPPWALMWGLSIAIFVGVKSLSWAGIAYQGTRWKVYAYTFLWPGLNPEKFCSSSEPPPLSQWVQGMINLIAGVLLLWWVNPNFADASPWFKSWLGMVGLILVLHFGALHLLSAFWKTLGCGADPLMNRPCISKSVAEFWSLRWNTAFRDLANRMILKPLVRKWGVDKASLAVYIFSGLVHDIVISFPAKGGYGLPTLYFLLQWAAYRFERSSLGKKFRLRRGWRGRWFTITFVLLPVGLLFHKPFALGVIYPFLEFINAL